MHDQPEIIRFDRYEIDPVRGELRVGGAVVPTEPQVLDLLRFLASNPRQILSKDALIAGVWGGRIVSESAIASRISAARQAIGDDGKTQRFIRTIPRRGVLFEPGEQPETQPPPAATREANGRPTLVIYPFRDLSPTRDQGHMAEGIAEDLVTNLAQFEDLVVIAPQSATAIRNSDENENQFAARLGVHFALDGGVQRVGEQLRISVRLIELSTAETLWADRFDGDTSGLFALQDKISSNVANALIGKLTDAPVSSLHAQAPLDFGAYDHALRAQRLIWQASKRAMAEARARLEQALVLDPGFARAHVLLSWVALTEDGNGWGVVGSAQYDEAVASARTAVRLDPTSAWARSLLGVALFWRDRDAARALEECRRGVELNPSNAHLRMLLGATLAYCGEGEQAIAELTKAMEYNPLFPSLYMMHRARAHFVIGDDAAALKDMQSAVETFPEHAHAHALLAVCLCANGRIKEARRAACKVTELSPGFTVAHARQSVPYSHEEHRARFCTLLTQAGLPEA